jgi:hypothetical protein
VAIARITRTRDGRSNYPARPVRRLWRVLPAGAGSGRPNGVPPNG